MGPEVAYMDVLSKVLDTVRLCGSVFFTASPRISTNSVSLSTQINARISIYTRLAARRPPPAKKKRHVSGDDAAFGCLPTRGLTAT